MANPNWTLLRFRALLIMAVGFWVFAPALQGGWLMDDDLYLTQNALLNDPHRLWKIWFEPGSLIEYYPIEASVQAVQWHLWHNNTIGYHLTNLVLHLLSALLVWRLLAKFGLKLAWLGGLLFAVHPIMVESVAWISELKNTLSLPPLLLAMCAWIDYEERKRPRDYLLALGFFLVAMLCKISMALFPIVILLYAWWKRDRIGWRDLIGSAPFFAISGVLGILTILSGFWFLHAHLQPYDSIPIGGFPARLALAGTSISFYFYKCLWPVGLLPIYPKWTVDPPSPIEFLPWLVLAGAACWFWMKRASWGRHVLLGLGFFLLNLAPFIGFQPVSYMAFSWVMDHFVYLPIVGLIGLAMAGLDDLDQRASAPLRPIWIGAMAATMGLLALESNRHAALYLSQETLWTYTIEHNPDAWLARNNLGNIYFETDRIPEAIEQWHETLRLNPGMAEAHNNLGLALSKTGHLPEAIDQYEEALKLNGHFALAHVNLGNALSQQGHVPEAIDHYEQALVIEPKNSDAQVNLAKLKAMSYTLGNLMVALHKKGQLLIDCEDRPSPPIFTNIDLENTGNYQNALQRILSSQGLAYEMHGAVMVIYDVKQRASGNDYPLNRKISDLKLTGVSLEQCFDEIGKQLGVRIFGGGPFPPGYGPKPPTFDIELHDITLRDALYVIVSQSKNKMWIVDTGKPIGDDRKVIDVEVYSDEPGSR